MQKLSAAIFCIRFHPDACGFRGRQKTATLNFCAPCRIFRHFPSTDNICKKDIIGKNVLRVFPGVDDFGLLEVFRRVWRSGVPEKHPVSIYKDDRIVGWRENYVYKLPSGEIVAVYEDVTERRQADEELKKHRDQLETIVKKRTHNLRQEILERKLAEEKLRKTKKEAETAKEIAETANQAKSRFLANMSHELRTPLNAILGFAQLMMRDSAFLPSQREKLDIINRSGEHLLMLINDILDMSKIEAGRLILRNRSFNLPHMLMNIEEMIRVRADAGNLKFSVLYDNSVPRYIKGDDRKLRQVLINLLNNAVKFTEKGSVTLLVSGSGPHLHFRIEDTGTGIAPSDLKAVFDVFTRSQNGMQTGEGTGLWLAISRRLARLMGGDITVASEVGKGSVFKFTIPVKPAEAAEIETEQSVRKVIGLEPDQKACLILIVEDNKENRAFLAQLLQSAGFAVQEAANGQEAIEMFANSPI